MSDGALHASIYLTALLFANVALADEKCTILYDVDASFGVSSTDFGKGNTIARGLQGSLVVQYTRKKNGPVIDGTVSILHYATYVNFLDDSVVDVETKVHYFTPSCNGDTDPKWRLTTDTGFPAACDYQGNEKPVATGTFSKENGTIKWDSCKAARSYWAKSRKDYTLSSRSSGKGCLNGLRAVGNVNCDGRAGCRLGDLQPGDNPQSNKWNQPMIHGPAGSTNTVSISSDLSTITTPLSKTDDGELSYEIPNDAPSRTWISWKATRNATSKYTTCP